MPHFVVDCSKSLAAIQDGQSIAKQVHTAANSTELFSETNIQVRINFYDDYSVGNVKEDFIHVFAHILEGRTAEQKLELSKAVVKQLAEMLPQVPTIGIDIKDLEKGTGFSKNKL